ncbi:uncharacterized protein LOC109794278 isoform X2 [Cajanus cajan]|uniref:uncharacterized protein LOC109794278 isoform X2 n=1 Tax=Cajanus cajan TaxID=3821 RepID=UPI00098DBA18|nr:uncharacterized protein LOC109794278 isoform X2 [Cajanus cajan]
MAFPLSPSLNLSIAPTSRITCFSKKQHAKEAAAAAAVVTSAETIMKRLRSVVPVVIASVQISALVLVVDYVSYPGAAEAVLYSPDTKVPRTGEVALRRAIPANASMKAIQPERDSDCKWVYTLQDKSTILMERWSATRPGCCKRVHQAECLDFQVTFVPVAKIVSDRVFLS